MNNGKILKTIRSKVNNVSKFYDNCCGCGVCANLCPVKAISMQSDKKGFAYPVIDDKLCTNCGLCVRNCNFNGGKKFSESTLRQFYLLKHKVGKVIERSQSGGAFTAISDVVLDQGGVVYGCVLKDCVDAVHVRAQTFEERDLMCKSKYIQSQTQNVFPQVKKDLQDNRKVLFTGTPCQIAAVKTYLKGFGADNLVTVELICHGVSSPKVWKDYVTMIETEKNEKVNEAYFRDKKLGWGPHLETMILENQTYESGIFADLMYGHNILRESCFGCPYKNFNTPADITIGDAWGVKQHNQDFFDARGVSLVVVNSEKGKSYFDSIRDCDVLPVSAENYTQITMTTRWKRPKEIDSFWKFYYKNGIGRTIDKYVYRGDTSFFRKVINKIKRVTKKFFRKESK